MNKPLILVVEDDSSVKNLITTTLKAHDYRHLTAPNGKAAILEASSHNPDIVLLDLGLPDIDGVDVIKKIRTWSNMPIIVISARSEDVYKRQEGGTLYFSSSIFCIFCSVYWDAHFYFDCCCGRHHSDCLATFPYFRLGLTSLWQLYGK